MNVECVRDENPGAPPLVFGPAGPGCSATDRPKLVQIRDRFRFEPTFYWPGGPDRLGTVYQLNSGSRNVSQGGTREIDGHKHRDSTQRKGGTLAPWSDHILTGSRLQQLSEDLDTDCKYCPLRFSVLELSAISLSFQFLQVIPCYPNYPFHIRKQLWIYVSPSSPIRRTAGRLVPPITRSR